MNTVYPSQHSVVPAAPKAKRNKKKIVVASAIAGTFLIPAAAWAAVQLFGFGSFSADASTAKDLTISGTPSLTKTLAPGQSVGVKGVVHNPNDFDIKVSGLIVKNASTKVTGGTAAECLVSLGSAGTAATFPAHDGIASGPGTAFALSKPITIPAGYDVEISVPGVVTQDAKATKFCGVTADYAVVGSVGE